MTAQKNDKNNILVFDTNIFLTGVDFNLIPGEIITTPKIIEEIKVIKYLDKNRNILSRIQAAIESKKLVLKNPSEKYIEVIENSSKKTGDYNALSLPDKELLALTLELINTLNQEVILYTNDYSMENICYELKIPFSPLNMKGIKKKINWEVFCPFCKTIYVKHVGQNICEICGLKLKRRRKLNNI